jgi:hypothetical protein
MSKPSSDAARRNARLPEEVWVSEQRNLTGVSAEATADWPTRAIELTRTSRPTLFQPTLMPRSLSPYDRQQGARAVARAPSVRFELPDKAGL